MTHADLPPELLRRWVPDDLARTVLGGKSALDLPRVSVADEAAARRFLHRYGYDLENAHHRGEIERIRAEALGFIRGVLLAGFEVDVPPRYDRLPAVDLLLAASARPAAGDHDAALEQAWACALLRVMHAFAHAENYFQANYYRQIREEIIGRFERQVKVGDDAQAYLPSSIGDVPLVRFEIKSRKPVRSVVLKLLHKAENVATDLFDHVGVRMIVPRPADALLAIRALHERQTIIAANIKPTRSRNTLIDLEAYLRYADQLITQWRGGRIDEETAVRQLAAYDKRPDTTPEAYNQHSSSRYRSIQFTCRQMIRFANPLHKRLVTARKLVRRQLGGDALDEALDVLSLTNVPAEIQFFFPFEVQIIDKASYLEATKGRASYGDYKRRQIASVRWRVLGQVLELLGQDPDPPARAPEATAIALAPPETSVG